MTEMPWLAELIGNYMFPIAACIYLAFENRDQRKSHREETAKLTEVLNANTVALTRLTDKMEEMLHEDLD